MNQNEEKLLEVYKELELLFKDKFSNEISSISEYVERMAFHKEEATKYISDWEDTIKLLASVNDKTDSVCKNKTSDVSTEDVKNLEHFISLVKKHEDPLQKYYVTKGFETIMSEVDNEDE